MFRILENLAIDATSQLADGLQTMNQREGCRTTDRILAKMMDKANELEMTQLFRRSPRTCPAG